ncbi:MAG: SNF2-related protein [Pseudomonadota bacterium]
MAQFVPGQRWISEMEPELGLGTLAGIEARRVSVVFQSCGCTRIYSLEDAPLKRIRFSIGDEISVRNHGRMVVSGVEEVNGLVFYNGCLGRVPEADLSDTVVLTTPRERLLAGMFDDPRLFDLRCRLLQARCRHRQSGAFGFTGGRIDLIPHQFYIAGEVTSRYLPRVLLADETGLGKTIEACLILHRLLLAERVNRVLILVPDSLVNQWFVELYRRFNLVFRIVTEVRPKKGRTNGDNPFLEDQLFVCSQDLLEGNRGMQRLIRDAGWDMLVVDEAHHLVPGSCAHGAVAGMAAGAHGLLLLTATPEQLGVETYFSLLRLLDPDRYPDLGTYLAQAEAYTAAAREVRALIKDASWDAVKSIRRQVEAIVDRHGPGRVIFRNTRRVIKGFPQRSVKFYRLDAGRECAGRVSLERDDGRTDEGVEPDFGDDPRIGCLIRILAGHPGEKMLLICSSPLKAQAVEKALKSKINMDVAQFNETMTLIQRDRSAAWFSEKNGARLMVCSEIGSEGRNFQFASHLILFDLPPDPELLEQRIGRLDRIGQTRTILIHVPCVAGSVTELYARWYHEGLGLFETMVSGVHALFLRFREALSALAETLRETGELPGPELDCLVLETQEYKERLTASLEQGRDLLLELNSFRPERAGALTDAIRSEDGDPGIDVLMLAVFDHYGIPVDALGPRTYNLVFEGIDCRDFPVPVYKSGGMAVTFDRKKALAREEVAFLTWDHPMVSSAVDLFLGSGTGNASLAGLQDKESPGMLLETVFLVECMAPGRYHVGRFLAPTPIRVVMTHTGEDVGWKYPGEVLEHSVCRSDMSWARQCPELVREWLPEIIRKSLAVAEVDAACFVNEAIARVRETLGSEVERLIRLKAGNPAIRQEEIDAAEDEMVVLVRSMASSRLRLDSLRLIRGY